MAMTRRVVVAGLGSIGRRHARLLLERNHVAVELVEPRPEALAALPPQWRQLPRHDSFEAMLKTLPDIVVICTPTPLHARQSIAALEAGAHVMCEKPMADCLSDALRVRDCVERNGLVFNVGFMLHFWPAMVEVRRLIGNGALGNILHMHASIGTYITLVNSGSRYQARQPGSIFWDYSHQPDLFYWLSGVKPSTVQAFGFQGGQLDLTSDPNVAAIACHYESELFSTIHLNYVQMPDRHSYEIVGDRGWIAVDYNEATIRVASRERADIHTVYKPVERDDLFRDEHRAFFDAVHGLRKAETSADDGLISTAICEAAVESWKTGRRVAVRDS